MRNGREQQGRMLLLGRHRRKLGPHLLVAAGHVHVPTLVVHLHAAGMLHRCHGFLLQRAGHRRYEGPNEQKEQSSELAITSHRVPLG